MRLQNTIFILSLIATVLFFGCNSEENDIPPNILWISAEDISPAFGCYGDEYARTPNIDKLAKEGIVYEKVYATAPICAPARSALITGIHATTTGTQHLRSEIPVPQDLKILPEYLKETGYYTTNNSKTDYNFDPTGRWDENGGNAHWKNRPPGTPFFSVFNYGVTHEGNTNKFTDREIEGLDRLHEPSEAILPPYFPRTEEMKTIWAHAYDLITKFDQIVGQHVNELKQAGELENTIIFVFSDHGFGLPRYKRWLYNTGLQVPLVVYVPDKYKYLFEEKTGQASARLVSFADFAPTVMKLAGLEPDHGMQGVSFSGKQTAQNTYLYGARSRADDVYDVSRLIYDGRYVYIRNFMPYKPYIQDAIIFGDSKRSFRELNRLRESGELNDISMGMYQPKASEELYDLENDPFELQNLAGDQKHLEKLEELSSRLKQSLVEKNDIGFLHESEIMIRSQGSSPYEIGMDPNLYNKKEILEAALKASVKNQRPGLLMDMLDNDDAGVRFWGLNGFYNSDQIASGTYDRMVALLDDPSPAVAILAAEILVNHGIEMDRGRETLLQYLKDDRPWVVLNAAISVRRIGDKALPVIDQIKAEAEKYYGDKGAGYNSWSYPMFIGFALDQAIINCK